MKRLLATSLALACLAATDAAAQGPGTPPAGARPAPGAMQGAPGLVLGSVVDAASGQPVPSASVAVRSAADSSLVGGAIARPDGTFRVEGLRPGRYYLRVSALGYTTAVGTPFTVAPAQPRAEVGAVRLAAGAVALEGLEVTAEAPTAAALSADRNVYRVQEMAVAGGTATDVLRNVPALEVDGDGKVSLRGNANVAVQINGRAAPMRGEQLTAFLQQLPAGMLDRVEVVPNPSAKHDPEGMAGIVNLVMRQNVDLGTSGGVTLGAATGNRYNASGNLGYQEGALTLFGSYGFNADERRTTGFHDRTVLLDNPRYAFQRQDIDGLFDVAGHSVNATADLRLGKRDVLSQTVLASVRSLDNGTVNRFRDFDAGRALIGRFDRDGATENHDRTLDYTVALKHTAEPQKNELSVEARVGENRIRSSNLFTRRLLALDGTPADALPLREDNDLEARTRSGSLQADYTRALTGRTRLETGYRGALRWLDNDASTRLFSYDQDAWLPAPDRGSTFTYDDAVHAVYGVLTQGVGRWELQGGLRAERATTAFRLGGDDQEYDNDYTSLFPSALVAWNLSDSRQVKASYSKRVQRPDTRLLNPFVFYEDPQNVMVGNPQLRPEYTHAWELGFQESGAWGSLQLTPYFRRTEDAVRRIRTVEGDSLTRSTFANVATSDAYGADVTGSLRRGERFSAFGGVNVFRMESDASNVGDNLSVEALAWSVRLNATWKVTPRLDVQGFTMYRAPMEVEGGRLSAFAMTHLSLRQKLRGDRASVSLRVVDPFNTMRFRVTTGDAEYVQTTERRFGARALHLSVQYSFGRPPRVRQPRPQEPPADPQGLPGY